jgi:trans-aconitate methyltransferase
MLEGTALTSGDDTWTPDEAVRYEEFAEKSFSWRCIEEPSLRSLIEPRIGDTGGALDLGCGNGRIIGLLRKLGIAEEAIFGIDSDQTLIRIVTSRYPNANFACQNITQPPYLVAAPRIDLATAHFVLQYLTVDELMKCLTELHRLLAPRGYLAIGLPHPARVAQQAGASYFARVHHRIPAPWGGFTTSSGLTVSDYLNCIMQARFTLRRVEEPEISTRCLGESGANAYAAGPTRLMILAQAVSLPGRGRAKKPRLLPNRARRSHADCAICC